MQRKIKHKNIYTKMISVTLADNFSPILRFFFSFSIMIMHTLGNAFIKTTSVSKNKSVIIVLSLMPTAFFYSPNDVFVFYSFCFSFLNCKKTPFKGEGVYLLNLQVCSQGVSTWA